MFMMLSSTSRTAALIAIVSLLSRSAAFVLQRSLSPGYGGVTGGKHEVIDVRVCAWAMLHGMVKKMALPFTMDVFSLQVS